MNCMLFRIRGNRHIHTYIMTKTPNIQKRFLADTRALISAFGEVGNRSSEVVILDTKKVLSGEIAQSITCAQEGKNQLPAFVKERLERQVVPFHDPIKMNKIPLPSNRHRKHKKKCVNKTKDDLKLMGKLCITLQVREGNMNTFFQVEKADAPPSLSKHDVLQTGQKSDLVSCLDIKLIDSANMVHFLRPDNQLS